MVTWMAGYRIGEICAICWIEIGVTGFHSCVCTLAGCIEEASGSIFDSESLVFIGS